MKRIIPFLMLLFFVGCAQTNMNINIPNGYYTSEDGEQYIKCFNNCITMELVSPLDGRLFHSREYSLCIFGDERYPANAKYELFFIRESSSPSVLYRFFWDGEKMIYIYDATKLHPHEANQKALPFDQNSVSPDIILHWEPMMDGVTPEK